MEQARRRAADWYSEHRGSDDLRERTKASSRRHFEKVYADPDLRAARLAAVTEWRAANPEKVREQNRAWCAANRNKKRAKDQRRRARLLDAFVAEVDPAEIWTRDEGICGICREVINPDLPWPHKMSKTLDHVVPLARGGTHEPGNIQLAHAVCNSRKNDRVALTS
jgi:5-methylcytosine-specific restriction endonuclease McrA